MKVLTLAAFCNFGIVLWMVWLCWQAYTSGTTFELVMYITLGLLNVTVLCSQWFTFKLKKNNEARLEEIYAKQEAEFHAMLESIKASFPPQEPE